METTLGNENILNVALIEPRLKHSTVFERFDELISGESLILHNDHDPKPLYYEISAKRGDIFTWEYLQQGPEVWKVKITKKKEVSKDDENILDATLLHPAIKHTTIFNRFDSLSQEKASFCRMTMIRAGCVFNWKISTEILSDGNTWSRGRRYSK